MTNFLKKAGLGVALAATALTTAAPAEAQWHGRGGYYGGYHHYHGGGRTSAALLGGIVGLGVGAAIASNSNRYYGRPYGGYGGYYGPAYYDRGYYYDAPRCWVERRYDPYYGYPVRVRVCN